MPEKNTRTTKSFSIYATLTVDVGVDIQANSLSDAIERSKELEVTDFITILGEYNDGKLKITGAFENV